MGKLEEYKEKKRIESLNFPKMYIVKSTRDGVDQPVELQVVNIDEGVFIRSDTNEYSDRYKFKEEPYNIEILRGKTFGYSHGYATGYGDLWCWSYFASFSLEEAEDYYIKEKERVENKYK